MTFMEVLAYIQEAEVDWTVMDLKGAIFADDLYDCEINEAVAAGTYHNFSLARDAMRRLGKTLPDLARDANQFIARWPESYDGEDEEFALWDVLDGYVMEVLGRDSRICKRAGW